MKKKIILVVSFLCCIFLFKDAWAHNFSNADYTDYFFDTYEEAHQEAIVCATAPDQGPNITCGSNYYFPPFAGGYGCWTGVSGNIIQVNCYYFLLDPPEEVCCKEQEGQCCPKGIAKCPKHTEGDPINVYSGNSQQLETDIELSTSHEKGFKLYRTYQSRSDVDSPIGYGWTHNYNVTLGFLMAEETNAYEITDESGRKHHYQNNSGGTIYPGIINSKGYLSVESGVGFKWYRANGVVYTFNEQMQFIAKTDGNGNVQTLSYDAEGDLESVTDEATGRSISFLYDVNGNIESISGPVTDAIPDGIWVTYQYDTEGNLTHVVYADDGNGSTASGFEYRYEDPSDVHNLTAKYNLTGEFISSWQYDGLDRAIANTTRDGKGVTISGYGTSSVLVTDEQGVQKTYTITTITGRDTITNVTGGGGCASCSGDDVVRYEYDDQRRVIEQEYTNGRINQFDNFDSMDRYQIEIQAVGTPNERTFYYTYHPETSDQLSILERSVLSAGLKETIFDYDDDGNVISNENPTRLMHRKVERGTTYDAAGALSAYEYITTYTYTAKGQVESIDGPLPGSQDLVSYTYDPATGDRLTETRPLVGTTSYTYDAAGNVETVTDVNGVVTTFTYDGRNRQLSATRNGVTTSRTYTAAGELDTATDALSRTMDYAYNDAGFVEKIMDPSGNFVYYAYNGLGKRTEESIHAADETLTHYRGTDWGDPANNPDLAAGKPWKSLHRNHDDTADLETVYAYDGSGNLKSVTDANSNVTEYLYDQFNRLWQVIQPGNVTTVYGYDIHGNLASVTDAEGHVTLYTYDDMGRLVETDSPDTGNCLYSYDAAGNLRFKTHNGQAVEYRYDLLRRLTDILYSDPAENVAMAYDTGSGANLMGRLAAVSDPSGMVEYSYNADGQLEAETRTIGGTIFVTSYLYDAAGNLRTMVYPTGQSVAYQPDPADPARIGAVVLDGSVTLASNIAYMPFGPVSGMTLGNGIQVGKGYDKNYQMATLAAGTVMSRSYTPDAVGNIEVITDNLDAGRSQSFGYDDLYRLTSAVGVYGSIGYTYDNVGNRLTRTENSDEDSYAYYPGTNRLHTITGVHAELFEYDADGNMVQRIPGANNPQPAITDPNDYTYNSSGQRAMKQGAGSVLFHYDQAGQLIAETDAAGNMIKAYMWLHGQPLAMIDGSGAVYYFHCDHLGTPQRLTDASGGVVWSGDYLPFGEVDVTVEGVVNNLRFAGQYFDQETGLHYNYHRYYDPGLGRYLRADPWKGDIKKPDTLHPYFYVSSNPINYIDKTGLRKDCGYLWCIPWFPKITETILYSEKDTWLKGADMLCYYMVRQRDFIRKETQERSMCMKLKREDCGCVFDKFEIVDGPTKTTESWTHWREIDSYSEYRVGGYMGHLGPVSLCPPSGENYKGPVPSFHY